VLQILSEFAITIGNFSKIHTLEKRYMKKKITSAILVLLLSLSLAVPAFAAEITLIPSVTVAIPEIPGLTVTMLTPPSQARTVCIPSTLTGNGCAATRKAWIGAKPAT
jgi:hypothetical protein